MLYPNSFFLTEPKTIIFGEGAYTSEHHCMIVYFEIVLQLNCAKMEYQTLNEFLGFEYDQKTIIEQKSFWNSIMTLLKIPEEAAIYHLYTSQQFAFKVIKFLLSLPYTSHSYDIINLVCKRLDPSPIFIKNIIQELVVSLQNDEACLSSLNICLAALKCIFQNQTPVNQYMTSSIYLFGSDEGMEVRQGLKWPFEKGGTFAFWYKMRQPTKQCKILQILSEEKMGIEIVMKNRKLYIQKMEGQAKFRLIKNTSTFLCEALFDTDVKLCIQFEVKKKFFQPHFVINVIMNNFVLNGVELDAFPVGKKPFKMSLFKSFYGQFYSCLFLTQKIAQQVQQLNSERGFMDENDIRNFTYLFEDHNCNILMLLTAIRAETEYEKLQKQCDRQIEDELKEPEGVCRPIRTILFDAINEHECVIGGKGARDYKVTMRKQIGNYGGFDCLLPFMDLLEISRCNDQQYSEALKNYLTLIKYVFLNRTDSIERAYQINFFTILAGFLNRTYLQGFCYQTISKLKEIHIALNTRTLRQKYLQQLVWAVNFSYLQGDNLQHYIRFIKTFYNEDIQTSLQAFPISSILNYIFQQLDTPICCSDHSKQANTNMKKYKILLFSILEIVQNILLIKRVDEDLPLYIREVFVIFGYSISPCFTQALINLIQSTLTKDSIVYKAFSEAVLDDNSSCKLLLYKSLSCCSSWSTKGKLIELIFKMLGIRMFDETTRQKQMLTLCARYPTMNFIRSSSIKSQENRDSVDFSQEKLSLNSASMNKLITISPIETDGLLLLDDPSVFDVISKWTFSQQVLSHVSDEVQNPGLLILMQLYKSSTYSLRVKISHLILQNISVIRFSPELMSWGIQCLLIAEFDYHQPQVSSESIQEIKGTQNNFYEIISHYQVEDEDENNELSIIKLVFSSVKSKYPDDITKVAGNKIFFSICLCRIQAFINQLKSQIYDEETPKTSYGVLNTKVISNVFTFISEYFILKGDDDQIDFEEELMEVVEQEMQTVLIILEKILEIFLLVAVPGDQKIIDEANAENNQKMCALLFPSPEKEKERVNFMALILTCVHNTFDFFEDMDVELKKKNLILLKKYLIFMVELTQNSGAAKLDHCQQELRQLFLNSLSFLQHKFCQYYSYPFERHENVGFQMENRIRKNIQELRSTIFLIFTDMIEINQFLDEKGSMEHKSFYELMKPKRKGVQKYGLKNIYPPIWKKADQKIIQFMCLKKETLRKDAKEKLENHLSQKKVSAYATSIQKKIAKKIADFVEIEQKQAQIKQKKSINFYKTVQSEKCRIFGECEQELTLFRLRVMQKQKIFLQKQKEGKDKELRQTKFIQKKIWNKNRTYGGFWTNKQFYSFAQNEGIIYNNDLKNFYTRVRSRRQSAFSLMPFIKIKAISKKDKISENYEKIYANDLFLQGCVAQKVEKKRKSEKIKIGFQFLKIKVFDKLVKTNSMKDSPKLEDQKKSIILFQNVLWVKPMKICSGYLKIQKNKLSFCHRPVARFEHLSLLDNTLKSNDRLIREWMLEDVQGYYIKRFLLKPNSVEIIFKTGKTLFISFYGCPQNQFDTFLEELSKYITKIGHLQLPSIRQALSQNCNLADQWNKLQVTQKWLRYEMSNFDYLMCLNFASGRTNNDLNQFPVFPWIFSQYRETKFKKNENKYRNFENNMGLQGSQQRVNKFKDLYNNIKEDHQQEFPIPHYFGFHYSNICIILQYLVRMNPYTEGAKRLQGDKFDIPDRLFSSIADSHKNATNQMSDVRELIPEFFYFPQFLINSEEYDMGQLQIGNKKVHNVQLPDGCLNPFDFIQLHREALESKQVSLNLHKWIDLIFGYKNSGKEADNSINTYHYLTSDSSLPILQETKDMHKKEAMESQMAFYGKTPSQLFSKPHPGRQPQKQSSIQQWMDNKIMIKFEKEVQEQAKSTKIILLQYCKKKQQFIIVYKDGRGVVFNLKNEVRGVPNIINKFQMNYRKFEGMNLMDPAFQNNFPIMCIEGTKIVVGGMWGGKILVFDCENCAYESLIKHSATVTALAKSESLQLMWSGSSNGQICKWTCTDRVFYLQKLFIHSQINCLFYYEDTKTLISGSEDGSASIISVQKMQTIRIIKIGDPVDYVLPMKYPFYCLYIQCRNCKQFCYTINGTKLECSEIQGIAGRAQIFYEDCFKQKILLQVSDNKLVLMKLIDFSIEQKISYENLKIRQFHIEKDFLIVCCEQDQIYLHIKEDKSINEDKISNGSHFLKINTLFS